MLELFGHPLSSYTQKVLVALYEIGADFTLRTVDLSQPEDRALMQSLEPMGRMPALRDGGRVLSQSSLMIEWLDRHHPGPQRLLDPDPDASLVARQWDRFLDFQVMQMMQQIVDARIFMGEGAEDRVAPFARAKLELAYAALDRRLDGRLAAAVMSIQAIKGVEVGDGFASARRRGASVPIVDTSRPTLARLATPHSA